MAEKMNLLDVEVWDGNMASSQAMRQAQIDVVAAYPITPSTPIVQNYSQFLADGYIDGEFVMVESEHAAMSGCVGAAAAGGRVATATSSQGFALMIEVLYQASGMRLPIVLNLVNRALASPLNVNGDHSDMYLGRDSGWIQLNTQNPQEAYDFTLMAFKIAEDHSIRLPVIVNQDGFMTSHTASGVTTLTDDEAYKFVGEYRPMNAMLDFENPATYGVQTEEDWHFEHKARQHNDLMTKVTPKVEAVFAEFKELTGREYNLVETYDLDDAEVAVFVLGSAVGTARSAATLMREQGVKVGVISLRLFRPFPFMQIKKLLESSSIKSLAILDRSSPNGTVGMLYNEISGAAIQMKSAPILSNYIYGLGGRDITIENFKTIFAEQKEDADAGSLQHSVQQFVNVRGPKLAYL